MKKALVVMAAWMGSRYWWLKQVDEFWPGGELILEYSVYDALKYWFTDIVFVIREDFSAMFREKIGSKIEKHATVHYINQGMDTCVPDWFSHSHRGKPRWTAHAILVANEVVDCPFMVINADDWYGRHAFEQMSEYLTSCPPQKFGMVGYYIEKTLSPYGTVNRGLCKVNKAKSTLWEVVEHHKIARNNAWIIVDEHNEIIEDHAVVSMNCWWFHWSMMHILEEQFHEFLIEYGSEPKKEFYIPTVCDRLIKEWTHSCDVMISEDLWCGVTYPEDKTYVRSVIEAIVDWWEYPRKLR